MKKLSTILLVSCLTFIAACSEKDVKYYQDNPAEAKAKIEECEDNFMKALMSKKSKEELKALKNNKECQAADQVLKAIRKAEREKARAEREAKIKAEKEALEKANKEMLAKAEENFAKEYGNMEWKAFQKIYKDHKCQHHSSLFSRQKLTSEDAECKVVKKHYDDLIVQAKNDFANQNFDELIKREKEFCQLDSGYMSQCSVWRDSLKASAETTFKDTSYEDLFMKRKDYCKDAFDVNCSLVESVLDKKAEPIIKKFGKDDELFKKTYTECYQKSLKTKPMKFETKGTTLIKIDPICAAIDKAAVYERNLYKLQYFRKPLE
ncbi:MAG: hypothetical protein KGV56_04855 [Gammaproteobacteria bacterium]|nr:hypothetical protein [Gammaproteobacteria bacterium]